MVTTEWKSFSDFQHREGGNKKSFGLSLRSPPYISRSTENLMDGSGISGGKRRMSWVRRSWLAWRHFIFFFCLFFVLSLIKIKDEKRRRKNKSANKSTLARKSLFFLFLSPPCVNGRRKKIWSAEKMMAFFLLSSSFDLPLNLFQRRADLFSPLAGLPPPFHFFWLVLFCLLLRKFLEAIVSSCTELLRKTFSSSLYIYSHYVEIRSFRILAQ